MQKSIQLSISYKKPTKFIYKKKLGINNLIWNIII